MRFPPHEHEPPFTCYARTDPLNQFHGIADRELAEQSKKHGNDLFGWGKKNPAQYSNCLKSYTVREVTFLAKVCPVLPACLWRPDKNWGAQ